MSGPLRKPPVTVTLTFDPEEMARRGRLGGRAAHARHDSRELTRPGRAAFMARFAGEADPEAARRAYFSRLGRLSAAARAGKGAGDAAAA